MPKETLPDEAEGASSLAAIAEASMLNELSTSISGLARNVTYACGGSVPIVNTTRSTQEPECVTSPSIPPVQIRYGEDCSGRVVTLPAASSDEAFKSLVAACEPATFGLGGQDVLDEDYRSAGKLNTGRLATSFCPYSAGVIDIVTQLLLPSIPGSESRMTQAVLYKLNVYSGPGGKSKPHVDTPRSENQFGSLVVCFPFAHKGGQLAVRNAGEEIVFDWTNDGKEQAVKWAAFYSDCEHEVLPVTEGCRLTLTYNLYISAGKLIDVETSPLNPTQLPLYSALLSALNSLGFLHHGHVLGIHLTHSYAHTHPILNFLPTSLKGADMVLCQVALYLGLKCDLRPIVLNDEQRDAKADQTTQDMFYMAGLDIVPVGAANVTWLNERRRDLMEPNLAHVAYGNQAAADVLYSNAALFIRVPAFADRRHYGGDGNAFIESESVTLSDIVKPTQSDEGSD